MNFEGKEGTIGILNAERRDNWTSEKGWFQGVDVGRLGNSLEGKQKSIYELTLKNEWEQESKKIIDHGPMKGAFELTKVTWGGKKDEKGYRWNLEKITIDENNKVWLIIAKGEESIYLIPAARSSALWGIASGCNEKNAREKVKHQDIDIGTWSNGFDKGMAWRDGQDGKLKTAMKSGFSIKRVAEAVIFNGGIYKSQGEIDRLLKVMDKNQDSYREFNLSGIRNIGYIYRNSGVLDLKGVNTDNDFCFAKETYFPLDLVVLGNTETVKSSANSYYKIDQKITITDTITEVIGVFLNNLFL